MSTEPLLPARRLAGHPSALPAEVAAKLGDDYERAKRRYQEADAPATVVGYASDWAKFEAYCSERGVRQLPAHPEVVASYLAWLADEAWNAKRARKGYKPATIRRARAAISVWHQKAGFDSPCDDKVVRRVLKSIGRRSAQGSRQRRAKPIMPEHLRAILAWISSRGKPVRDARDKAILLAGWAGAFRESELVALRLGDVRIHDDRAIFFVSRSKTDPEGKGVHVDYSRDERLGVGCPIAGLREWTKILAEQGGQGGPFIRRVRAEEVLDEGVSKKKVDRLVREGAGAIGLDPADYSSHSLRAGIATWLIHVARIVPYAVKTHLRHKTVAMLDVYVRDWDELPPQPDWEALRRLEKERKRLEKERKRQERMEKEDRDVVQE